MPTTCNIVFDNNPSCTFYGGQILTAKISLNLDETREVKGIALKISGYADTRWNEQHTTHNKHRHSTVYTGHEDYINVKTFLLGTPETESITLPAGEHTFSFNYHLPDTCPSSIESQYGKIRYKLKVMLIRPWKFDKTFTKGFTVVKLVDLNYLTMVSCPIAQEIVKKFGMVWKTEPLTMRVSLPVSGYVSGQKIPVSVSITNESGKPVKELKISLVMLTTCHSQTPTHHIRDHETKVSKIKNEILVNHEKCESIYELPVPPLPPSDNAYTTLIHISYQVKVEAVMPLMQSNQVAVLPVVIGSVPLTNVTQVQYPTPIVVTPPPYEYDKAAEAARNETAANVRLDTPTAPPWESGASNMPPPTYEEAMFMPHANMAENEKHDYGENDFVPRYPVFNVPTSSDEPARL